MSEDVFNLLTITGTCKPALAAHGLPTACLQPATIRYQGLHAASYA